MIFGLCRSKTDARDRVKATPQAGTSIPDTAMLVVPPASNQGALATCACGALANYVHMLVGVRASRMYLFWNARVAAEKPTSDNVGVSLRDACKALSKHRACEDKFWPYIEELFACAPPLVAYENAKLCPSVTYARLPHDAAAIKQQIASGAPVLAGIVVYPSLFDESARRCMPDAQAETPLGASAVLLCGYDATSYVAQGSWGTRCGDGGLFVLDAAYVLDPELTFELWTIDRADYTRSNTSCGAAAPCTLTT